MASTPARSNLCLRCAEAITGKHEGVTLTVCCRKCIVDSPPLNSSARIYDSYLVSKTQALRKLKCPTDRLELLDYTVRTVLDEYGGRNDVKLYIHSEVEAAMTLKNKKRLRALKAERKRTLLRVKRVELEKRLDMNLDTLDPVLCHFLIRDFFKERPRATVADIQQRANVLTRVGQILAVCPRAHPEAAFEFCLENPDGGPDEFQDLKEKMTLVFRQESTRILHKVPKSDVVLLRNSALGDLCREFLARDTTAIVSRHLTEIVGKPTADAIMGYPGCQGRLGLGGDERGIAEKLAAFWKEKDDTEGRRERLHAALGEYGLPLRKDCALCDAFITGELDADVEEVLGAVATYVAVSAYGSCPHGIRGLRGQGAFMTYYYDMRESFEASVEAAIDAAMTSSICSEPCGRSVIYEDSLVDYEEYPGEYTGFFSDSDYEDDWGDADYLYE